LKSVADTLRYQSHLPLHQTCAADCEQDWEQQWLADVAQSSAVSAEMALPTVCTVDEDGVEVGCFGEEIDLAAQNTVCADRL
jgi:hypothetical protein